MLNDTFLYESTSNNGQVGEACVGGAQTMRGVMYSCFDVPATRGVYVCCWLLAVRVTRTVTVVA